jgi:hypothetical protein
MVERASSQLVKGALLKRVTITPFEPPPVFAEVFG